MENIDDNTLIQEEENYEFHFNFINTPWDDRSNKSKVGIVLLLTTIFVTTISLVAHNLIMHYGSPRISHRYHAEDNCQSIKVEDHRYVARIHMQTSHEPVCVGAVIADNLILANKACVRRGLVRIHVGSLYDPRCKKGYAISGIEQVIYDNIISTELVILSTYDSMSNCIKNIEIGSNIRKDMLAYVIGRPSRDEKLLSRHPVSIEDKNCSCSVQLALIHKTSFICVKNLVQCPMLVGDLLVQNDQLFGMASTSIFHISSFNLACYTDVSQVEQGLKKSNFMSTSMTYT